MEVMQDLTGSQRRWMRVGVGVVVLPAPGAGEDPGSRVLDILEPVQGFAGNRIPGGK